MTAVDEMHRSSERARPASGMESRISGAPAVRKHESAKAAQAGSRLVAEPRADKRRRPAAGKQRAFKMSNRYYDITETMMKS